jgi:predicted nucleic acid-binding protein
MLLDSNIIIYATQPEHAELRAFIATHAPVVSAVSYVEVLGYHKLLESEAELLRRFFAVTTMLPLDQDVLGQAVRLRRQHKLSLGDALISATALVHRLTLVTHNVADFDWIDGLELLDPLA